MLFLSVMIAVLIAQDDQKDKQLEESGVHKIEPMEKRISFEFIGMRSSTMKQSGEPVTVGVFRLSNHNEFPIIFADCCRSPDLLIKRLKDGEWKFVRWWSMCAMGRGIGTLDAGKSLYFYIDPEYYRSEFGDELRFGIGTGKEGSHKKKR